MELLPSTSLVPATPSIRFHVFGRGRRAFHLLCVVVVLERVDPANSVDIECQCFSVVVVVVRIFSRENTEKINFCYLLLERPCRSRSVEVIVSEAFGGLRGSREHEH